MSHRRCAAAVLLPVFVLAACGADSEDSVSADGPADTNAEPTTSCAPVSGPMVEINTTADEPQMQLPQLDGWERNSQMDSEIVRLALVNPERSHDGFIPNLVVTGEASPSDPQESFDLQLTSIREGIGVPEQSSSEGEICGYPAMAVEYTLPGTGQIPERPATMQMVVVADGDDAYTYTFTTQSAPGTDQSFGDDIRTMIEGVQISD